MLLYVRVYIFFIIYIFYTFRFEDVCHGGGSLGLTQDRKYANQCCEHVLPSVETVQNRDALAVAVVRSHNDIHN